MDNKRTVNAWQKSIINECRARLNRDLTNTEKSFINSRGGFLALEAIEDTVKALGGYYIDAGMRKMKPIISFCQILSI